VRPSYLAFRACHTERKFAAQQQEAVTTLLGHQRDLAKLARLDVTTVDRLEGFGPAEVRGKLESIEAVVAALEKRGVEFTERGVQLTAKRGPR
jgi:hypothetical protein